MKYNIYIRGRGWAFQLANSLNKENKLNYLVTSYPKFMTRKYNVPNNKTKSIFFIDLLTRFLNIIHKYFKKININIRSTLIVDALTDYIYSLFYIDNVDYYILGFGGSTCKIIAKAKKKKIKTIYFLNNSSPLFREKLKEEYKKLDLMQYYRKEDPIVTKKINLSIQQADYVGCISSFQRETYIAQGILEKEKALTTIMGVDTSVFYPQKKKIINLL
mgnify:FL=1